MSKLKHMPFRPTLCKECGCVDEIVLQENGPHFTAHCLHCGDFLMDITQVAMPDLLTVKREIWRMCNQDIEQVNALRDEVSLTYPIADNYVFWWSVYILAIRKALLL